MMIITENNKVAAEKLLNKSSKLTDLEKTEYFKKLYELDVTSKRYPDNPKFLITLVKWFLEDPIERQYNLIKLEFETYLEQVRLQHWKGADVTIKDISKFSRFQDFATEVHRITAKYRKSDSQEQSAEIKDLGNKIEVVGKKIDKKDITYQTDEVVVAKVDDMHKSIAYGSGFSDWCTARTSGNYFYEYRFGSYGDIGESTLYYVYFPKRYSENANDPKSVLNFGVNDEGDISYTDRSNTEMVKTLDWLKAEFPEFKDANMEEIFPHDPITNFERKVKDLPDYMVDEDFYKLSDDEKLMYLQSSSDRNINLNKFKSMSDRLKSSYLGIVENSHLLLSFDVFYSIINTAFGRRYIKNMTKDNIYDFSRVIPNISDTNKVIEVLYAIIENKKDAITPGMISEILHIGLSLKSRFGYHSNKNLLKSLFDKLGPINVNKLMPANIVDFLMDASASDEGDFNFMVNSLGKENILKLNNDSIFKLLSFAESYGNMTVFNFVLTHALDPSGYYMNHKLVDKVILTAIHLNDAHPNTYDIEGIIVKLLGHHRYRLTREIVVTILSHTSRISDTLSTIANRFDTTQLLGPDLFKILSKVSTQEALNDFEKSFSSILYKIEADSINRIILNNDSRMYDQKVDLLIKYTLKTWSAANLYNLFSITADSDLKKIKYINMLGKDLLDIALESKVVAKILSQCDDVVSVIEAFGSDYIVAKVPVKEYLFFNKALFSRKTENTKKLISFIVSHYELSDTDIFGLFTAVNDPILVNQLIGDTNVKKLQDLDLIRLLNNDYLGNDYLGTVLYQNYISLFKDKILKWNPRNISALLDNSKHIIYTVDFLLENNYVFNNEQICVILNMLSRFARRHGKSSYDILKTYANKLGVDRIKNLDTDSIVFLMEGGFKDVVFLLDYVPMESFNGDIVLNILRQAKVQRQVDIKYIFNRLKNSLPKLISVSSELIVNLMESEPQLRNLFLDYILVENRSMLKPDMVIAILHLIGKSFVSSPNEYLNYLEKLTDDTINKALDTQSVDKVNNLVSYKHDGNYYTTNHIVLLSKFSPNNFAKITDDVFEDLTQQHGYQSFQSREFAVFLKKPNLTESNLFCLIKNAPDKFFKQHLLDSLKPKIKQMSKSSVKNLLVNIINLARLFNIIDFLGVDNIKKLDEGDVFSILNTVRYDKTPELMRGLLIRFKDVLYKMDRKYIDMLKTTGFYDNLDFDILLFIRTKKFTPEFLETIKKSNYKFLQTLTDLNAGAITINDYLRVVAEYIRSHNNTLNYTEFEVILRDIEKLDKPDVLNEVLHFLSRVLKTKLYTYLKTYNYGRKYNDKVVKEYKRFYSDLLLEDSSFSQENLNKALDIERRAYPPHMQMINSYIEEGGTLDINDIAHYLKCGINDIVFYMGENWFIIGCVKGNTLEIADWASAGGMSPGAIKKFFSVLSQYKDKTITCSARETTSYKLIKTAETLGYVTIYKEDMWNWGGVNMIDLEFKFNDKLMNRISRKKKTDEVP